MVTEALVTGKNRFWLTDYTRNVFERHCSFCVTGSTEKVKREV